MIKMFKMFHFYIIKPILDIISGTPDPVEGKWIGKTLSLTQGGTSYPNYDLIFNLRKVSPSKFIGRGSMETKDKSIKVNLEIEGQYSRGSKIINYTSVDTANGKGFHGACVLIGIDNLDDITCTMQGFVLGHRTESSLITVAMLTIKKADLLC